MESRQPAQKASGPRAHIDWSNTIHANKQFPTSKQKLILYRLATLIQHHPHGRVPIQNLLRDVQMHAHHIAGLPGHIRVFSTIQGDWVKKIKRQRRRKQPTNRNERQNEWAIIRGRNVIKQEQKQVKNEKKRTSNRANPNFTRFFGEIDRSIVHRGQIDRITAACCSIPAQRFGRMQRILDTTAAFRFDRYIRLIIGRRIRCGRRGRGRQGEINRCAVRVRGRPDAGAGTERRRQRRQIEQTDRQAVEWRRGIATRGRG